MNTNQTQWFIMIGSIEHTRYFHINTQTGQLILIRPVEEIFNKTTLIELKINITNNWIDFQTIRVNLPHSSFHFYSSFFLDIHSY